MMGKIRPDTIKPAAVKSSTDGETDHEIIYTNPTYKDNSAQTVQLEN